MNTFGRVAVCGAISQYNATEQPKGNWLINFIINHNYGSSHTGHYVSQLILGHQLRVEGFLTARWLEEWPKAFKQMSDWISEVTITQNVKLLRIYMWKAKNNMPGKSAAWYIFIYSHALAIPRSDWGLSHIYMDGSYTYALCASYLSHKQFDIRENSNMKKPSLWDLTMRSMLSLDSSLEPTLGRRLSRFEPHWL